jgi:hypothetical protein
MRRERPQRSNRDAQDLSRVEVAMLQGEQEPSAAAISWLMGETS